MEKTAWIIVGSIVAGLSCLTLLAVILMRRLRRHEYDVVSRDNSVLDDLPKKRTSPPSQPSIYDRHDTGELQRQSMIRKSLASRPASWASENTASMTHGGRPSDEESSIGLREDWKMWEAQLQQTLSLSLNHHPAVHAPPPPPISSSAACPPGSEPPTEPEHVLLHATVKSTNSI